MAVAQGTQQPTFHKTKAAWADAIAAQLRSEARAIRATRKPGALSGPDDPSRQKCREAAKFDRMAAAFRKKGL